MRVSKLLVLVGGMLLCQQALAGGGFPEPLPEENPPASFRLYDEKRTELTCKLCGAECPQEAGYKQYRYKYERRWHNYQCKKTARAFIGVRSYDESAK